MGLRNILLRIKTKGYFAILAHPERYQYMAMKDYTRLKSMRVKLLLNLFSLFGKYEKEAQKKQKGCSQKVFMIVWEQIYIK